MAHTSTILFWSGAHLQEMVDVGHHLAPQCRHKTGAGWAFGAVGAQVAHNLLNPSEDHDPLMIEGVFEASGAYEQVSRPIQWVFCSLYRLLKFILVKGCMNYTGHAISSLSTSFFGDQFGLCMSNADSRIGVVGT
jgi:hypothetical protein